MLDRLGFPGAARCSVSQTAEILIDARETGGGHTIAPPVWSLDVGAEVFGPKLINLVLCHPNLPKQHIPIVIHASNLRPTLAVPQ